jgi:endo-1,4-beta-D-glucanase Y
MKVLRLMAQLILFNCLLTLHLHAQNFPFPQNQTYAYGLKPQNAKAADAQKAYNTWKANFLTPCSNGRYRVKFDNPSQTVSEGIAYGMLLTAYAGDQAVFDGLWKYYQSHANNNGFMNWRIEGCDNASGFNGATDAELDATMALIIAHYQWGSNGSIHYQNVAKNYIALIKQHEIEAGTFVLKPGDAFGGSAITNPSYFAPGYYRAFGQFANDESFWNQVAAKSYEIINKNLSVNNAAGGLVSDWCAASGSHSGQAGGYFSGGSRYHYDAARTPWRIATDYIWFGTAEAAAYCKKASDFVRVQLGGSANIKDGYYQNGSAYGQYHNSTFVGAFATAAIAGQQQAHLDASYADLVNINDDFSYFNHSLKTLYLFQLTGNFYLPTGGGGGTPTNQLPQVAITSPTDLSTHPVNQTLNIKVSASDSDGSVVKTVLYINGQPLSESANGSLTVDWQSPAPGSYTLVAKAYDNEGAQATSSPVTITVFDPNAPQDCENDLGYSANAWVVRNAWADQNNQSGVSMEAGALKVSHRVWGQDYLWVVNTQQALKLVPNVTYTVAFDLKTDASQPLKAIEAAFVSNVVWNGPQQIQASAASAVSANGGFQTYIFNLKASATQGLLGLKLQWNGQPSAVNHHLIKNLRVCATTDAPPPPNKKPTVSIVAPTTTSNVGLNEQVNIKVNAADEDGQIVKTELYINNEKVSTANGATLSFNWQSNMAGTYTVIAKTYDNDQAEASSTSLTLNVVDNTPAPTGDCYEQLALPASAWVVRNAWADQNNQAGVSNESGSLKVQHRAWGQNFLWAVNRGKGLKLQPNRVYEISFQLQLSQVMPPQSLEVGLVSDVVWNGPQQVYKSVVVELATQAAGFQTYKVRIKTPSDKAMHLGFKFNWAKQPPLASANYLREVAVCLQNKNSTRTTPKVSAYPNPNPNGVVRVHGIPEGMSELTYTLRSNQGKVLTSGRKTLSQDKSFGLLQFDLATFMKQPGTYLLEIRNGAYRKMMTIVKK